MTRAIRKAVFPVAGLGTRFLPATKALPKELLPIVDRPLIQYAIDEARAIGVEEFIFVTSRSRPFLEAYFGDNPELTRTLEERGQSDLLASLDGLPSPDQVFYASQDEPLGLGHAVWCARDLVGDEPFAVLLPDDLVLSKTPCLEQLADAYRETGGNLVAVIDVPREQTARYGILDVDSDDGRLAGVKGLVEKPAPEDAPSTLSIIGRYILQPEVFSHLDRQERGAGGEIQLTDAMARMIGSAPFHGLRFEGVRYDCGNKTGFVAANVAFALARPDIGAEVRAVLRGLLDTP
jgi:UTP--glucose-1-phosphate uridylyltransferase